MGGRTVGLYVTHRQAHEPELIKWQEFLRLAEAAAKAKPVRREDLPKLCDRCQFVSRQGKACKLDAMRGATRCQTHGGPRQVPHHPVTVEMWNRGEIQATAQMHREAVTMRTRQGRSSAVRASSVTTEESLRRIRDVLSSANLYTNGPHARAGRTALRFGTAQDWQAWLAETHQMAAQMRAEIRDREA